MFSPGRGLLFSGKVAGAVSWYIPALVTQPPFPRTSPPNFPLQTHLTRLQIVLPSLCLIPGRLAGNAKPVHWPLRRKETGKMLLYLQWALSLFSGPKYLQAFTTGCCMGGWSQHWCSVLGTLVGGPGFIPLPGKLPQLCRKLDCHL